jgi:anti-anti-sigma regulatory factor
LRVVPTFKPRGLKVIGTVDDGTVGGLIDALNEAIRWPEVVLHLDLAELDFSDAAGVRAIVRLAGRLGDERRRLQLDHLKPTLSKVMTIVGWDRAPGLRIFDELRGDDLGEEVGSA